MDSSDGPIDGSGVRVGLNSRESEESTEESEDLRKTEHRGEGKENEMDVGGRSVQIRTTVFFRPG